MTLPPVALKRKNHRLLLCEEHKKQDLLTKLIFENAGRSIAVVVHDEDESIYVPEEATLFQDSEATPDTVFDLLITYDLPTEAEEYFNYLSMAKTEALCLFDPSEQSRLLAIETALGRSIKQEYQEEYSPKPSASAKKSSRKKEAAPKKHAKPKTAPANATKPKRPMLRIKAEALNPKKG